MGATAMGTASGCSVHVHLDSTLQVPQWGKFAISETYTVAFCDPSASERNQRWGRAWVDFLCEH